MKESLPRSEKEIAWEDKLREVDSWADFQGRGIDEGIKETVVAFNLSGFPTEQSCEGHANLEESHSMWPWIRCAVPGEPEERYVGQNKTFEQVAEEHCVNADELKRGTPEDLYWQVINQLHEETPEYVSWDAQNEELEVRARETLEEFYNGREIDPEAALIVDTGAGGFEICSNESNETKIKILDGVLTPEEIQALNEKLPKRQREMSNFTAFLKQKYFN